MKIINWQDTYSFWRMPISHVAPELLKPVPFEHIQFKYEKTPHHICGYDWLHKDEYMGFLLFGESLNKGILKTAKYFAEAKDDSEPLALIWISSFIKDLTNDLRENLRGNGYRWLQGIEGGIYPE